MVQHRIDIEIGFTLAVTANTTAAHIRSFLARYRSDADLVIEHLIGAAPQVAEAVLVSTNYAVAIDERAAAGSWYVELRMVVLVSTVDGINEAQVARYFEGFYDQGKTKIRQLVAAAPPSRQATIPSGQSWHLHRDDDTDPIEQEP